ncbi:MAG: PaaI family thioesterase [Actinomycetia bacterium]|nr:PaaI family thioesterase [Actinomycetes bacterium]
MGALEPPPNPYAAHLGMRCVQWAAERTVVSLTFAPALTMPYGVLHGGALASLVDTAAGWTTMAGLASDQRFATAQVTCQLLRPVTGGTVTAAAERLHGGRRTTAYLVRVVDGQDRLVAVGQVLQVVGPAAP